MEYERTEILEFENVYFFNIAERKKSRYSSQQSNQIGKNDSKLNNYGFDND